MMNDPYNDFEALFGKTTGAPIDAYSLQNSKPLHVTDFLTAFSDTVFAKAQEVSKRLKYGQGKCLHCGTRVRAVYAFGDPYYKWVDLEYSGNTKEHVCPTK